MCYKSEWWNYKRKDGNGGRILTLALVDIALSACIFAIKVQYSPSNLRKGSNNDTYLVTMFFKGCSPFVSLISTSFWNLKSHLGKWLKNACVLAISFSEFWKIVRTKSFLAMKFTLYTTQYTLIEKGTTFCYNCMVTPIWVPWNTVIPFAPKHKSFLATFLALLPPPFLRLARALSWND